MESKDDMTVEVRRDEHLLAAQHEQTTLTRLATFGRREWIVMTVVAVLAIWILLAASHRSRLSRFQSGCASHQGRLGEGLLMYAANHEERLPWMGARGDGWLAGSAETVTSNSKGLLVLLAHGYVDDTHIFRCPAAGGQGFVYQTTLDDFPEGAAVGYSYQHSIGGGLRLGGKRSDQMVSAVPVLADLTPLIDSGQFDATQLGLNSRNHDRDGQNVLYLSGYVRWARSAKAGVFDDDIYTVRGVTSYRGTEQPADTEDTFLLPAMPQR